METTGPTGGPAKGETMRSLLLGAVLAASCVVPTVVGTVAAAPAQAATSDGCTGGGFAVTTPDGRTASGRTTVKLSTVSLGADEVLRVRGRYVEFDLAPVTGNVYRYVYTGAANPFSMTPGVRTPVWDSKTLDLGPVLRSDVEVRVDGGDLQVLSRGRDAKVKVQAKDCATGGVFQQEAEAATAVTATHTLAAGMFYYVNPYTGKVNFGNGTDFRGKDSAQVAARQSQTSSTTVWRIEPGGRMGQVLGEDAVELSAGPTVCVTDCQAQNQIRGSLPVTDPAYSS
jgi:hypothetical protein